MAIQRLMNTTTTDKQEKLDELSLRPKNFEEYIGQERLKTNLKLAIQAAKKRGEPIDHVLLYGPPGLGKTTMATVIANEMGSQLRATGGPAIDRAADLASLITNLKEGDILFIDEIHRLSRSIEEILYSAMEDFKLDIILGKGPSARSLRLDLPRFTLVGATTRAGALSPPLRDRFGIIHRLEFYGDDDIAKIIKRSAKILKAKIDHPAASDLATRSRLTPRIANRLLKRVRDHADVNGDGFIDTHQTKAALKLLEIDHLGLEPSDRMFLESIVTHHAGGPVGLNTISAMLGDEPSTIEDHYEPFLLQIGLIERTPRGRRVTAKARQHLASYLKGTKS